MSDKEKALEQRLNDLAPGPWTPFNPLNAGWAITSPAPGVMQGFAYVRYCPWDNSIEMLFQVYTTLSAGDPQRADGYGWANLPSKDAEGNRLLPPQAGEVLISTDRVQSTTPSVPRVRIGPAGAVTLFGLSTAATFMRCYNARFTLDDLGVS